MTAMALPVSIRGVKERPDPATGIAILTVTDPNALTQVTGWLKFRARSGVVLLRGQERLYDHMCASGFRSTSRTANNGQRGVDNLSAALRAYINTLVGSSCCCTSGPYNFGQAHICVERVSRMAGRKSAIVQGTYRAAVEPLLQHYGIRTRWLDVVDNIWIALWFACHKQVNFRNHSFHSRRSTAKEDANANAYIAVFETGPLGVTEIPGYWVGATNRLVDLRYAVPSVYLRPHAQHGLLIAPAKLNTPADRSLLASVVAYLEIPLVDALEWLGRGVMASPHVLFPPAFRDEGFRRLIDFAHPAPPALGGIAIYGPGY